MRPHHYAVIIAGSALVVLAMGHLQINYILQADSPPSAYVMPLIVGSCFGVIVARVLDLSGRQRESKRKLEETGKTVARLNAQLEDQLDITRTAHQEVEARYTRLVETSVDAILTLGRDGTILLANPAAEELLGPGKESLVGREMGELTALSADDQEAIRRAVGAVWQSSGHQTVPLSVHRPEGSDRVVEAVVQSSGAGESDRSSALLVLRDVTESRQLAALNDRVRNSQRLESLGKLAGGVAHDFNNLLSVILTNVELVEDTREHSKGEVQGYTGAIRDAAERGSLLTRQLLAFGRRQFLSPRVIDLGARLIECREVLEKLLDTQQELVLEIAEGTHRIEIDPGQVDQVLRNLVTNARDAMPEGGRIIVTLRRAAVVDTPDLVPRASGWIELSVSDEGAGMDEEALARCMEPFFTTKDEHRGAGLGLSTVHGIVDQSGGRVQIDSTLGRGTTVTVYFPATSQEPTRPPRRRPDAAHALEGTVLLVEDEPAVLEGTRRLLERAGLVVTVAEDGLRARALLEERPDTFDIVVSDVVMPGMDGRELAHWIQDNAPSIPVLLATGHPGASPVEDELDVIRKPYTGAELRERIAKLLAR